MTKVKEKYVKTLETFNMMNDYLFKSVFRSIEARNLVIRFLSAITEIDLEKLKEATFEGGDILKSKVTEKGKVSDIIVRISDIEKIIVEANNSGTNPNIFRKNSNYAFSIIVESTLPNEKYAKIILINIDNFNKFKTKKPILHFKLRDEEGNIESEIYDSIHLILENCVNQEYNKDIKKEIIDFSKFLKMNNLKEMIETYKKDGDYMAAVRKVEDLSTDPRFVGYYDKEEAIRQEMWEVREAGIEMGISQSKIEIAKSLLKSGMNIQDVSLHTNLSIEELESLK